MRISVVITSYNQKAYLEEAVNSVLSQTRMPFEIIICDDGSSDGSQQLIRTYEQKYTELVKPVLHEKNLGISRNRNSGLDKVTGDLVTWLDGDDRFKPGKLETELKAYSKDPDVKWVYSQVDIIDKDGAKTGVRYQDPPSGYILDNLADMLGRAPRNQMVECSSLKKIGFFKEDMSLYEDFDLCLRLAKNYKAAYCPEPLVEYRRHPGGVHNLSVEDHRTNLNKLRNNFRQVISDHQHDKKAELEEKLLRTINDLLKRMEKGRRSKPPVSLFSKLFTGKRANR